MSKAATQYYLFKKSEDKYREFYKKYKVLMSKKKIEKNTEKYKEDYKQLFKKTHRNYSHSQNVEKELKLYIYDLNKRIYPKVKKEALTGYEDEIIRTNLENMRLLNDFQTMKKNKLNKDKEDLEEQTKFRFRELEKEQLKKLNEQLEFEEYAHGKMVWAMEGLAGIKHDFRNKVKLADSLGSKQMNLKIKLEVEMETYKQLSKMYAQQQKIFDKLSRIDDIEEMKKKEEKAKEENNGKIDGEIKVAVEEDNEDNKQYFEKLGKGEKGGNVNYPQPEKSKESSMIHSEKETNRNKKLKEKMEEFKDEIKTNENSAKKLRNFIQTLKNNRNDLLENVYEPGYSKSKRDNSAPRRAMSQINVLADNESKNAFSFRPRISGISAENLHEGNIVHKRYSSVNIKIKVQNLFKEEQVMDKTVNVSRNNLSEGNKGKSSKESEGSKDSEDSKEKSSNKSSLTDSSNLESELEEERKHKEQINELENEKRNQYEKSLKEIKDKYDNDHRRVFNISYYYQNLISSDMSFSEKKTKIDVSDNNINLSKNKVSNLNKTRYNKESATENEHKQIITFLQNLVDKKRKTIRKLSKRNLDEIRTFSQIKQFLARCIDDLISDKLAKSKMQIFKTQSVVNTKFFTELEQKIAKMTFIFDNCFLNPNKSTTFLSKSKTCRSRPQSSKISALSTGVLPTFFQSKTSFRNRNNKREIINGLFGHTTKSINSSHKYISYNIGIVDENVEQFCLRKNKV